MIEITSSDSLVVRLLKCKPRPKNYLFAFVVGLCIYLVHLSIEGIIINLFWYNIVSPIL